MQSTTLLRWLEKPAFAGFSVLADSAGLASLVGQWVSWLAGVLPDVICGTRELEPIERGWRTRWASVAALRCELAQKCFWRTVLVTRMPWLALPAL